MSIELSRNVGNGWREEHALSEMPRAVRRPLALDLLSLYEEVLEIVRTEDELDIFFD